MNYNPATNPNHQAELAAERVLLASATLLRNTQRQKPIQAKRHLARMLREVPLLATVLDTAQNERLETRMRELADAYQAGNAKQAQDATRWIEVYLYYLCH